MRIHPSDNVEDRNDGQKYALVEIATGENIIKYGFPIGHAKKDIHIGDKVDPSNLKSNLTGLGEWTYTLFEMPDTPKKEATFMGYQRANGDVGIRNELWIVPTVGCANGIAENLAEATGAKAMTHPYGCSQLGGDHLTTQKVLRGLIHHPNAGGVLVLGLGCENNGLETFRPFLGEVDESRVKFLNLQDCEDEMAEGIAENPSPGNIAGVISSLEEKSLGCVQKAGYVPLVGALDFGETPDSNGLYLVNGPGNDMVAVTTLASCGAQLILFTTGRGTPLCGPVPTLKIATNSALAKKKSHWIDFDAGILLDGTDREAACKALYDLCIATAEGKESKGEISNYADIAIFKNGVTL